MFDPAPAQALLYLPLPIVLHRGRCIYVNMRDGTQCDDGRAYTVEDQCENGLCVGRYCMTWNVSRLENTFRFRDLGNKDKSVLFVKAGLYETLNKLCLPKVSSQSCQSSWT